MYLTWLEKTNNERKEYLQEIKDNLNIEYEESEFLNKWNKFLNITFSQPKIITSSAV